jgi:hypothetical protein
MPACAASACEVATQLRPNIGMRSDGYPVTQSNGFIAQIPPVPPGRAAWLGILDYGIRSGIERAQVKRKARTRGPALRVKLDRDATP